MTSSEGLPPTAWPWPASGSSSFTSPSRSWRTWVWVAVDYDSEVGAAYEPPSVRHWLGTDVLGREVFQRVIHGSKIAIAVGLITSLIAIPIGVGLGALAGYYGGLVDALIVWLYSTAASVPGILLLVAFTLVLGKGIFAVYLAIGLTTWVGICRLIRGEFIKHRTQEYVLAARALNAGNLRIIFRHILPNVFHLIIINFSLRFVFAIKTEVILSYLGLGVQGQPSWGIMIDDARQGAHRARCVVAGRWCHGRNVCSRARLQRLRRCPA